MLSSASTLAYSSNLTTLPLRRYSLTSLAVTLRWKRISTPSARSYTAHTMAFLGTAPLLSEASGRCTKSDRLLLRRTLPFTPSTNEMASMILDLPTESRCRSARRRNDAVRHAGGRAWPQ